MLPLVLGCLCTTISVSLAHAEDWTPAGERDGIHIYRRESSEGGVVAMRGIGVVDGPLWKIASILLDTARAPEWVDNLKESRVVRRLSLDSYIEYNHVHMPFIVKDRDFVSEVHIEVHPESRTFALVYRPADDAAVPATHNVRGDIVSGRIQAVSIVPGRQTELTAEVQADPKGFLPTWIVNFFQRNWPLTTFAAIRRQAAKGDIGMPDAFRDVLEPTRGF
jgi:hypothetical protein